MEKADARLGKCRNRSLQRFPNLGAGNLDHHDAVALEGKSIRKLFFFARILKNTRRNQCDITAGKLFHGIRDRLTRGGRSERRIVGYGRGPEAHAGKEGEDASNHGADLLKSNS